jgi:hypothetical protein
MPICAKGAGFADDLWFAVLASLPGRPERMVAHARRCGLLRAALTG